MLVHEEVAIVVPGVKLLVVLLFAMIRRLVQPIVVIQVMASSYVIILVV